MENKNAGHGQAPPITTPMHDKEIKVSTNMNNVFLMIIGNNVGT